MLSHLFLSKCLALGWVPIVWGLCQPHANATLAKASVSTEETSTQESSSDIGSHAIETTASAPIEHAEPTAPASHPKDDLAAEHTATTANSEITEIAPSQNGVTLPKQRSETFFSQSDSEFKRKPSKGSAPLLEEFFSSLSNADDQPAAIFPPDSDRMSAPVKPSSDDEPSSPLIPDAPVDPELGIIEVGDPRRDPELGVIELRNPLQDRELGILELRQISPPSRPQPSVFVSTYVAASSSDNVFLVEDSVQGRFGDTFIRPGISVIAFPSIGPQTNLIASVETNLLRYQEQSESSYDEIRFRGGIRHRFSDRVYGQVSFSSQLLFEEGYTDQFFTNNGIEVTIGRRDLLTPQLTLDSYYQGQVFFSDPSEFSNVLNSVGAYLGYRFAPQWDTGIGYRLTISDFTQQSRHETYQRVTGQLRYSITPSVRVSIFGGLSYGRSSEERITFDDSFFGISFDATIQLF